MNEPASLNSMEFWIIQASLYFITFWSILRLTLPGTTVWEVVRKGFSTIGHDPKIRTSVAILIGILLVGYLETAWDPLITKAMDVDYTPLIYRVEGNLAALFQRHHSFVWTYYFYFIYVFGFSVMLIAVFFIFAYLREIRLLRILCCGYSINFLLSMPFYILFPVKEAWLGNPEYIYLRLNEISPRIIHYLRTVSAADNCFPSLHTSLAWTVLYVVLQSKIKNLGRINIFLSVSVVCSTLYLGIHWVADIVAGCLLAALVCGFLHYSRGKKTGCFRL